MQFVELIEKEMCNGFGSFYVRLSRSVFPVPFFFFLSLDDSVGGGYPPGRKAPLGARPLRLGARWLLFKFQELPAAALQTV